MNKLITINNKNYKTYNFNEIDRSKYHGFIYVTVNKVNGKKYVGQHIRWKDNYFGSGTYILNALNKYGEENFERFIIDLAKTQEELDKKEAYYINEEFNAVKSKDWYNIKDGSQHGGNPYAGKTGEEMEEIKRKLSESNKGKQAGEKHPMYGKKLSESHRMNISKGHKGKKVSEETKRKISESRKGLKLSEETRKKISDIHKGQKRSESTRLKMSKARKGKYTGENAPMYGVTPSTAIPILVYKDGEFYGEFPSIFDFAKTLGAKKVDDGISKGAYALSKGWIPRFGRYKGFEIKLKQEVSS